jgi:hypothetical protein
MTSRSLLRTLCLTLVLAGLVAGLGATTAHAQRTSGAVGLGGQVGSPSGLSLKFYNEDAPSYDFLAAWDLDDFFFLNGHATWNFDINAENIDQDFEWFVGPGAYIGIDERRDDDPPNDEFNDEAVIGISGTVGLNFVIDQRFEFYGRVTPRIDVIPSTDGNVGGGIGFRYYF